MGRPAFPLPLPFPLSLSLALGLLALTPGLAPAQAPDARPLGGQVVAGQASIAQTASRTQVTQGSDRAVIEWQRFDIGAQHRVDIRQPSAAAWSLQRVTGGDPSAIAGRLTSNGGVALVNPAGVLFSQGAQVDVAALIATTADITNQNFIAGRMAFDGAARPGARVENRGRITVAEQGLAALVGPAVANSGSIRARLGRVALAGGEAFALDLAGDGLLALDVTRQVSTAPGGGLALVTQSGSIEAAGGSVLLTARAASGVIETLVQAGGSTAAPTLGTRTGTVALRAAGGGVAVTGAVTANGGAGARGGTVEATASGSVLLASGSLVAASGGTGGGRVAIGAGAESLPGRPQRLAQRTVVAPGARIAADATGSGPGGRVTIHAAARTEMRGTVSASGTPGGAIEVSSRGALALDGAMDAGADGRVLVDPVTLRIVDTLSGASEPAEITAAAVNATTGALTLQADASIRVEAAIAKTSGPLALETTNPGAADGEGIFLFRPLRVTGDLVLRSAGEISQSASGASLNVGTLEARSGGGAVRLEASGNAIRAIAGGSAATRFGIASSTAIAVDGAVTATDMAISTPQRLTLRAPLTATGTLDLAALRGVSQAALGAGLAAGLLRIEAPLGAVALTGAGNRITSLGDSAVLAGLSLVNDGALDVAGGIHGGRLSLTTLRGDLTQDPAASRIIADELQAVAEQGSVLFDGPANGIAQIYGRARDAFLVDAGGTLLLAAPVTAGDVELRAAGGIAQDLGARLTATRLRLSAVGGAVTLDDPLNEVAALGDATAGGAFALATAGTLAIEGAVAAPSLSLTAGGDITAAGGSIATPLLRVTSRGGRVRLDNAGHAIEALGGSGAAGDFALATGTALRITGAVDAGGALALAATAIDLEARLSAASVRLQASAGDIGQTAEGGIAAARLIAEAPAGDVRLAAGANAVTAIGGVAGGEFALSTGTNAAPDAALGLTAPRIALGIAGDFIQAADAAAISTGRLEVRSGSRIDLRAAGNAIRELGTVVAPGGLALATTTPLLLALPLDLPDARLSAAGGISQLPGAPLTAFLVQATSSAGDVLLDNAGNDLARLGASSAAGAFRLASTRALAVEGPVAAGTVLALQAGGDISQSGTGAGLSAPLLLVGSAGGSLVLDGAGNRIAALGDGFAAGDFVLRQEGAAPLRLSGLLTAPGVTLRTESGVEDATGGALRVGLLRLDTTGAVRLDAAGQHLVSAVGGRTGGVALATEGALSVAEFLFAAGTASLDAAALTLDAPLTAAAATLVARAGDITQAASGAGLGIGGALSVTAAGSVALEGAGNTVIRLAAGSASGGFALASGTAMTVAGTLTGRDLVLRAGGTLTLDGARLTAERAVLLGAPGGLSANATSRLLGRDPAQLPVLILDTRRSGGLTAIPAGAAADLPGLPAAQQATQLGSFGLAATAAAGPAVFDLAAGLSPVFLLLDGGSALGVLDAGRLGVLASGGSAFILGTLAGAGGGTVAQGVAVAAGGTSYLFNNCVMGAALCTPPPAAAPVVPPVTPDQPVVTPAPPTLRLADGTLVPGATTVPRLLAADLRAGEAPAGWNPLLPPRREEEE